MVKKDGEEPLPQLGLPFKEDEEPGAADPTEPGAAELAGESAGVPELVTAARRAIDGLSAPEPQEHWSIAAPRIQKCLQQVHQAITDIISETVRIPILFGDGLLNRNFNGIFDKEKGIFTESFFETVNGCRARFKDHDAPDYSPAILTRLQELHEAYSFISQIEKAQSREGFLQNLIAHLSEVSTTLFGTAYPQWASNFYRTREVREFLECVASSHDVEERTADTLRKVLPEGKIIENRGLPVREAIVAELGGYGE